LLKLIPESAVVFVESHAFVTPHMLFPAVFRIITPAINRAITGETQMTMES
jgi:hypothetical protein